MGMQARFGVISPAIAERQDIGHAAFRLYAIMSTYADRQGVCWPSVGKLAEIMGTSERQAQLLMAQLVEASVVERRAQWRNDGGQSSNLYVLADFTPGRISDSPPGEVQIHPLNTPLETEEKTAPIGASKNAEPPAAQAVVSPVGEPDGFARWYARYPLKKGRASAAKAFRSALGKASLEELDHGLDLAIADWRQNESFPRFVPHPTTWLNRGSWADEHYSYSKPANGKKSYTELMREYLTEGEEENGFDIEGTFSNLTSPALLCAHGTHDER